MVDNLPNLKKTINPQMQDTQRNLIIRNMKKNYTKALQNQLKASDKHILKAPKWEKSTFNMEEEK